MPKSTEDVYYVTVAIPRKSTLYAYLKKEVQDGLTIKPGQVIAYRALQAYQEEEARRAGGGQVISPVQREALLEETGGHDDRIQTSLFNDDDLLL